MPQTQFDLANMTTRAVNLLGDQGRAAWASAGFALRNIFAAVNANFCRSGIEIGLEHEKLEAIRSADQPLFLRTTP